MNQTAGIAQRMEPTSIVQVVQDSARANSLMTALDDGKGRSITYQELTASIDHTASALISAGLAPGQPVGLYREDDINLPVNYLAVIKAGGVLVPVNSSYRVRELIDIHETVEPAVWLTDAIHNDLLVEAGISTSKGPVVLHADTLDRLAGGDSRSGRMPDHPHEPTNPVDVVAFTSGTTGAPKGACLRRAALASMLRSVPGIYRMTPGSNLLYSASMAFIPTVLTQIIGALSLGSRVTLLRSREADKWLDQVGETAAELTYVPTPLIDEFAAAAESNQAAASSLRSVFHAGSQASRHDMTRLLEVFGSRVLEAWGMTETCGTPICATSPTDLAHIGVAALCETVGKAVNGASLSIVDPDAATGAGELVVEAPFLLDGYLESGSWKPSSTSGGGFNTGDVGRIDSDGYVRLVGRSKELIISGGVNVSPSEVEHCISQLQGVVEVGVFGLPHRRWGEAVAAAVVVEAGVRLEAEDVRNYVRTQLSRFKVPDSVFFVEQIPKTASMKVKRHELRHMFAE